MTGPLVPYRCLSCRLSQLAMSAPRRQLHQTASRQNRKSAYPNVLAKDLGLVESATLPVRTKDYTAEERKLLAKKYTPEQMAAIDMGEASIPAEDLERQGLPRTDPMRVTYFDDFSTHRPVIDFPADGVTAAETAEEFKKLQARGEAQEFEAASVEQAAKIRLMKQTGLDKDGLREIKTKPMVTKRVMNQTGMGKIMSFYVLAMAGNENGMLGLGEGKSREYADALRQAQYTAIRNMKPVLRYEDRTIFGDLEGKVAATVVQLQARPPGFGNRCQSLIFQLARAAGIRDIAARTPRSRNKMNVLKAAYKALMSQRSPEDVAKARGRKLVDVRKVYYAGSVP